MPFFVKKIVSGKRIRTKQHGLDLDITYITDRILAMSFPADDWKEKSYRNNISDVSTFLDISHPG
jgi:phosphatidylinositol-3,4,5-trisphosphate 3-phosphatase/dual-specificity protein phosphatase PTEN